MSPRAKPVVVKVGGSLIHTGRLDDVVRLLVRARRPLALVPGGGPFADAVREAQRTEGFDDATAHRMALLAMHQTAMMMAALDRRLELVESLAAVRQACRNGQVPIWLPYRLAATDDGIPADWSITSDGLAARLAERLGWRALLVIKSCNVDPGASLETLSADGIVDPTLAVIARRAALAVSIVGVGDEAAIARQLEIGTGAGQNWTARRARGKTAPEIGSHADGET